MNNTNPILNDYLKSLSNCKTYNEVLDYCNHTFKHVLGKGSSRKVYKIPHFDLVVKVAMKEFGITQNKTEVDVYNKVKNKTTIISELYDYDKNGYKWLLSEYCYINGCDESDDRMDKFIQQSIGISGPLLRLLCVLCMDDVTLNIIKNYKKEFIGFTNWIKENLDDLWKRRKEDKHKCRDYLYQYISDHFPNLIKESVKHDWCLHYYFITCFYHIRKVEPETLFDYIFNKKYTSIPFVMEFRKLTKMCSLDLLDAIDVGNMGIVKRKNKKYLVLLDYGYTET